MTVCIPNFKIYLRLHKLSRNRSFARASSFLWRLTLGTNLPHILIPFKIGRTFWFSTLWNNDQNMQFWIYLSDYLYTLPYVFITLFYTAPLVLSLGCLFCPSKVSSYKFILWFLFLLLNAIELWRTSDLLVLHQEMSGEPVLNTVGLSNLSGLYKLCCSEMSNVWSLFFKAKKHLPHCKYIACKMYIVYKHSKVKMDFYLSFTWVI